MKYLFGTLVGAILLFTLSFGYDCKSRILGNPAITPVTQVDSYCRLGVVDFFKNRVFKIQN